jgi:hypothetical protein
MMDLLLLLLVLVCVSAGPPTTHAAARRTIPASLRDQPFPRTLGAAKALHAETLRRARRIERQHGHSKPAAQPVTVGTTAGVAIPVWTSGSPILPADFGADPTGAKDSTQAMQKAVVALLSRRGPSVSMASNITDLGGATLDLSGGSYLISSPLVIPPMFGNAQIVGGTLRASPTFPPDRWLVEIGDPSCVPRLPTGQVDVQGSCGQFFNLNEMMFDASHVAAGGVRVSKTMGTTIGPSVFFHGFTQAGVQINGGHEVMIQQGWFCECEWSEARGQICQEDPDGKGGNISKSIGVQINGNDNFMTDVIVFEYTAVGVELNGAANLLQGVHTWNAAVYDHGGYTWKGGVGIAVNQHQNRLIGCYLDFSALVVKNPSELVVEATFFLAAPAVFTSSGGATRISGVYMHGNTYATGGDSIRLDPAFTDGKDCVISEDIGSNPKTTRASRTAVSAVTAVTSFNFSFPELLLPEIEEVEYSFVAASASEPWAQHRALKNGTAVSIQFNLAVRGQVSVAVRQAVHGLPHPPDKFVNAFSGLCLDSNGGSVTTDGNPVDTWTCVDGATNEDFVLDKQTQHLVGQNSKKCLSLRNCSGGAPLCIQTCEPSMDAWSVSSCHSCQGDVVIRPDDTTHLSSECLQVVDGEGSRSPGAKAHVGPCDDPPSPAQLWRRV